MMRNETLLAHAAAAAAIHYLVVCPKARGYMNTTKEN